MYSILGGDGKEYGPVTLDQVKAWISEGRANYETKVKRVGEEAWIRIRDLPEMASIVASVPPPMPNAVSANTVVVDPEAYANDLIKRAGPLDITGCIERSWNLLKSDFWPTVGATAVSIIVNAVAGMIPFLGGLVNLLLGGVFNGGRYYYFLKKLRGQSAEISDVFAGFSIAFAPLLLTGLISSIFVVIGVICLIIPGIYLGVAYTFAVMLVIDKKMDFWPAMEVSRRVISAQWFRMFGLLILAAIISALGVIGLFIGVFITMPIGIGAIVYAYEDMCNPPPKV